MTDAGRQRLDALTGLRFVAISFIVVRHLGEVAVAQTPRLVQRVFAHAFHVMPLFFVLSGFVITYQYGERVRSGELRAREFWISRLLRIWPIYLVALALRVAVDAHGNGGVPRLHALGALSQALLLQGWTPPLVWFGNVPGWTVSVEAFLYLVFPWLVVRISRLEMHRALGVAAVAWFLGQLVATLYMVTLPDGWPPRGEPSEFFLDLLRYLPPLHLPSFLIGVVTARVYLDDRASGRRRAGGRLVLVSLVPILFAFCGGFELIQRELGLKTWTVPFGFVGLLSPAWAIAILGLSHGGTASRWLGARPLVRLGAASYGLYILHFPIFDAVDSLAVPNWDHSRLFLLQAFAVLLPLSVISFERFEQPLRSALLARWVSPDRARAVTGA